MATCLPSPPPCRSSAHRTWRHWIPKARMARTPISTDPRPSPAISAASASRTNMPCNGWMRFLYYYTNYGVKSVLNFNAGTILLAFMLYKLGIDNEFKISVFFGSDNPYHAFWIMHGAKLFSRDDGTSPLIGFNWSNSVNNETMELTAQFRKATWLRRCCPLRASHHRDVEVDRQTALRPAEGTGPAGGSCRQYLCQA